jgi:lipopolysaccharide export system permease protein
MIFSRALRREFAHSASAVFIALFAILVTTVLIRLLGQAAGGRVPADAVLSLIGLGAIAQLPVVLTLSVFIAILMSLSRAYRDSEMVVWAASGVSLTTFLRPVVRFAVPFVLIVGAASLYLAPWANLKSSEYQAALASRDDTTRVAPGVFRESASAGRVFFVEHGATEDETLRNVFVVGEDEGVLDVLVAAEGAIHTDDAGARYVVLNDGRRFEGAPGSLAFRVLEFDRYTVQMSEPKRASTYTRLKAVPTDELLAEPTPRHMGELASRISLPVSCLLLAVLAIPLAYVNPRAGRGNNLIFAVLAYLVYSNVLSVFQSWVGQERMPFGVALLLPHVLVLGIATLMIYRQVVLVPFWRKRS